jgi:uncharacterized protein (TIGR03435 family)
MLSLIRTGKARGAGVVAGIAMIQLMALQAWPQAPAAGRDGDADPQFEVAAIKPCRTPGTATQILPGGRLRVSGLTLRGLIRWAYNVRDFQISGGPSWVNTDRYDIDAKPASGEHDSRAAVLKMLQRLLTDRFKLTLRPSSIETAGYQLVVSRNGSKLQFVSHGEIGPGSGITAVSGKISAKEMPLGRLANHLGSQLGCRLSIERGSTGTLILSWSGRPTTPPPTCLLAPPFSRRCVTSSVSN